MSLRKMKPRIASEIAAQQEDASANHELADEQALERATLPEIDSQKQSLLSLEKQLDVRVEALVSATPPEIASRKQQLISMEQQYEHFFQQLDKLQEVRLGQKSQAPLPTLGVDNAPQAVERWWYKNEKNQDKYYEIRFTDASCIFKEKSIGAEATLLRVGDWYFQGDSCMFKEKSIGAEGTLSRVGDWYEGDVGVGIIRLQAHVEGMLSQSKSIVEGEWGPSITASRKRQHIRNGSLKDMISVEARDGTPFTEVQQEKNGIDKASDVQDPSKFDQAPNVEAISITIPFQPPHSIKEKQDPVPPAQPIQHVQNAQPPPSKSTLVPSTLVPSGSTSSLFNDDDALDVEALPCIVSTEPEPDTSVGGCLSVSTRIEYSALPSGSKQNVFGLVTVQAVASTKRLDVESERQPIDIVCVLDVSCSMEGDKVKQVQDATRFIIDQSGPKDRLSLIGFNSAATRLLRLRKMNAEGKNDANVSNCRLSAGGGTSIAAGLAMGLSVMEKRRERNKVSAILLLTDGQDTSTRGRLPMLLRRAALANCAIYAFGFGRDHDAALLSEIAERARTPFTFVEDTDKIREAFAGTVGGLSSIVAQNVELTLKFPKPLKTLQTPFPVRKTDCQAVVSIPDMFAEERRDILVELSVPAVDPQANWTQLLEASARYVDLHGNRVVQTPAVAMGAQRIDEPQPEMEPDEEVGSQRVRVEVTRALENATRASDFGQFNEALRVIDSCDTKVSSLKKKSAVAEALGQELEDARNRMRSKTTWEQGGRAEILDATQMHRMQRSTNLMQSEGSPVKKSGRRMYANTAQTVVIERSKRDPKIRSR